MQYEDEGSARHLQQTEREMRSLLAEFGGRASVAARHPDPAWWEGVWSGLLRRGPAPALAIADECDGSSKNLQRVLVVLRFFVDEGVAIRVEGPAGQELFRQSDWEVGQGGDIEKLARLLYYLREDNQQQDSESAAPSSPSGMDGDELRGTPEPAASRGRSPHPRRVSPAASSPPRAARNGAGVADGAQVEARPELPALPPEPPALASGPRPPTPTPTPPPRHVQALGADKAPSPAPERSDNNQQTPLSTPPTEGGGRSGDGLGKHKHQHLQGANGEAKAEAEAEAEAWWPPAVDAAGEAQAGAQAAERRAGQPMADEQPQQDQHDSQPDGLGTEARVPGEQGEGEGEDEGEGEGEEDAEGSVSDASGTASVKLKRSLELQRPGIKLRQPSRLDGPRRRKLFILCGFDGDTKAKLHARLSHLRGRVDERIDMPYRTDVYVLAGQPCDTPAFLWACVARVPILLPSFVEESFRLGRFVDHEEHIMQPITNLTPQLNSLSALAEKWRLLFESRAPPLEGKNIIIYTNLSTYPLYVVQALGGTILRHNAPFPEAVVSRATHLVIDKELWVGNNKHVQKIQGNHLFVVDATALSKVIRLGWASNDPLEKAILRRPLKGSSAKQKSRTREQDALHENGCAVPSAPSPNGPTKRPRENGGDSNPSKRPKRVGNDERIADSPGVPRAVKTEAAPNDEQAEARRARAEAAGAEGGAESEESEAVQGEGDGAKANNGSGPGKHHKSGKEPSLKIVLKKRVAQPTEGAGSEQPVNPTDLQSSPQDGPRKKVKKRPLPILPVSRQDCAEHDVTVKLLTSQGEGMLKTATSNGEACALLQQAYLNQWSFCQTDVIALTALLAMAQVPVPSTSSHATSRLALCAIASAAGAVFANAQPSETQLRLLGVLQ